MNIFVGHSFNKKDEQVVNSFKNYIRSLGFTCSTGEKSENKGVSIKVKERIQESDIFVGIFTRDKLVFNNPVDLINNNKKKYTTSNWVIQESGYAIGQNKEIIILQENNLYNPPGLQGDLEYIPFNRDSVEKSYPKLAEMLTALKSKTRNESSKIELGLINESAKDPIIKTEKKNREEDTEIDAAIKFYDAFYFDKNYEILQQAYEELKPYLKEQDLLTKEAEMLKFSALLGNQYKYNEFISFCKTHEDNPYILHHLADYYKKIQELDKAKEIYTKIKKLLNYKDTKENLLFIIDTTYNESNCTNYNEALNLNSALLNDEKYKENKHIILANLASLAIDNNDLERFYVFAEYSLSLEPLNPDLRFKLAYNYNKNGFKKLSFIHYKKLLNTKANNKAGLNNIGVLYDNFKLDLKCISSYNEAIDLNETLAMSNLANKYLREGFIKEARELINKANKLATENIEVDGNIGITQNQIENLIKNEEKKEKDILEKAEEERKFKIKYSEAYCKKASFDYEKFAGCWKTPFGEQEIKMNKKDGSFNFEFKTEFKSENDYKLVQVEGVIVNLTATYKIKVINSANIDKPTRSILIGLGSYNYYANGYAIIDDNYSKIEVHEKDSNNEISLGEWTKVTINETNLNGLKRNVS